MGSKLGLGTGHFHANKGHVRKQNNAKNYKHLEKAFHIDLEQYGGDTETAQDQILEIFDNAEGKTKVKELVISPEKGTHLYKVKVKYKIWV